MIDFTSLFLQTTTMVDFFFSGPVECEKNVRDPRAKLLTKAYEPCKKELRKRGRECKEEEGEKKRTRDRIDATNLSFACGINTLELTHCLLLWTRCIFVDSIMFIHFMLLIDGETKMTTHQKKIVKLRSTNHFLMSSAALTGPKLRRC